MFIGVCCGFGAAILQSLSYIASRNYTHSRSGDPSIPLLVLMHLWLGILAAVVLPFVWIRGIHWEIIAVPIGVAAVVNVVGQAGLTAAIRLSEPSRVSPLLTMKVFFPALLTMLVGPPVGRSVDRYLTSWQWAAVLLCIVAGVSISRSGGAMRRAALVFVVLTALVFAASDWCVGLTVGGILRTPMSSIRASLLAASILYLLTGIFGVVALFTRWGGSTSDRITYPWRDWRDSFFYAATWFLAMIALFVAFAEVGVVLGTILQCTRSIITILMGVGLMYLGQAHIEPKQPPHVVASRIAAGVLMFLAISLYIVRDPISLWNKMRSKKIQSTGQSVVMPVRIDCANQPGRREYALSRRGLEITGSVG